MEWIPKPPISLIGSAETKDGGHTTPKINWGRGRLLPYESLAAFTAKFCVLNGISWKECRLFFALLTGENGWWVAGFKGGAVKVVASLLNEPESTVSSLAEGVCALPVCYGTFSGDYNERRPYSTLAYCPACRRLGYHASFHEISCLRQCLIHHVDLVYRLSGQGDPFEAYCKELWRVFDGGSGRWLTVFESSEIKKSVGSSLHSEFLKWLRSVGSSTERLRAMNVVSLYGDGYRKQDLGVLFGRLQWHAPLPNGMKELLQVPPYSQTPSILPVGVKAVRKFIDLLASTVLEREEFVDFYRMTTILNKEKTKARQVVVDTVRKLKKRQMRWMDSWGWHRRIGWVSVDPEGWPYWQVIKAKDYLIQQLQSKWMHFDDDELSHRARTQKWMYYVTWARIFQSKGIVKPNHKLLLDLDDYRVGVKSQPLVNFTSDPEVLELLETLLLYEARADVEDTYYLIDSVRHNVAPNEALSSAASNGNLFLDKDNAYFLIWPRASERRETLERKYDTTRFPMTFGAV